MSVRVILCLFLVVAVVPFKCATSNVVINELLLRPPPTTQQGSNDTWLELSNLDSNYVELSDWMLYNSSVVPVGHGYIFPTITIIPLRGFLVVQNITAAFQLNILGGNIYLFFPNGTIANTFTYSYNPPGYSIGRFVTTGNTTNSTITYIVTLSTITKQFTNSAPLVGPIVIKEVFYSASNPYIVLFNTSPSPVCLCSNGYPYKLSISGTSYTLPPSITLNGESSLIISKWPTSIFKEKFQTTSTSIPILSFSSLSLTPYSKITIQIPQFSLPPPSYYTSETYDPTPFPNFPTFQLLLPSSSLLRINPKLFSRIPSNWATSLTTKTSCCIPLNETQDIPNGYVLSLEPEENSFLSFLNDSFYVSIYTLSTIIGALLLLCLFLCSLRWLIVHGDPKVDQQ